MRSLALLSLLVALVIARPAAAQSLADYDYENLDFRGIGFDVGYVFPAGVANDVSLGIRADLGYLGPNVRIVPGISLWSSELDEGAIDDLARQINRLCQAGSGASCVTPDDLGEIDISDLNVNVDALYEFETPLIATPYVGAGGGLHLFNGPGALLDGINAGINVIGGLSLPAGDDLSLYAEGRYALVSDFRHAALSVGGIWIFGPSPSGNPPASTR